MSNYPRGSEWRQWDLHIHSPASFEWSGPKFQNAGDGDHDEALIDQMIEAMNAANPAVFALMDYWSFDGWFALKRRLAQPNAPQLHKTVFPGIELRLCAPMQGRLNAHVIFSDTITHQQLLDFRSYLKLELIDQPLSDEGLINYARQLGTDKLSAHGFDKNKISSDASIALEAGYKTAELKAESYKIAIEKMPEGMAVGFMPFSTNDGLTYVKIIEHYAYVMSLFRTSPIFETRNEGNWNAFVGQRLPCNEKYFDTFQEAMQGVQRLPVSGSDAHCFVGNGTNDKRGYGNFPSGKITWIKADPTWLGLLQALKEPKKRCFIGTLPPKLSKVNEEKSFYIERIMLSKEVESCIPEIWLDGCNIELNTDLVAIIGNKGSGKSALADAIALLGRSQENSFSFLKKDRFRGKSGEPARHFTGQLFWKAGGPYFANLAEDPSPDKVELVKYIPQGRFEALCNDHVTGSSRAFENELRSAIFSHIPAEQRLASLSFDQLVEEQEKVVRDTLNELRKNLRAINDEIISIEDQLHLSTKRKLEELLALKDVQLQELQAAQPVEQAVPSEQLTTGQQEAASKLETLATQEVERNRRHKELIKNQNALAAKRQSAKIVTEQIELFEGKFAKFTEELSVELVKIGLASSDVVELVVKRSAINTIKDSTEAAIEKCQIDIEASEVLRQQIEKERNDASNALNEPQKQYQAYLEELRQWNAKIEMLMGDASIPESKVGLQARLDQIGALPSQLDILKSDRLELLQKVFSILDSQRKARAELFAPIQKLITDNELIHKEYKLQFQANLVAFSDAISSTIFSILKQNSGDFRGEEESRSLVKALYDQFGCQEIENVIGFVTTLAKKVEAAAESLDKDAKGIRAMLRKNRRPEDFYNYLFGLEFVDPKYSLLFQETPIEQLSPGQRGALLLIFYLLVDKSKTPIVLDQPEENLDNETIVSLLVPVIEEAKKNRQIIMVTHNPNLAVVCDAEQIVVANFERNNASRISYYTGSIEDARSNKHIIDILEGTKRAFDNRSRKYFTD